MIKIFANEESLKGDRPIITPIPIEIKVFLTTKIKNKKSNLMLSLYKKLKSCQGTIIKTS